MKPEIQAAETPGLRMLVVEDDPILRLVIADALRGEGVTVVEAASGVEAWEALETGISVDLIFTDHRMPGAISGAELAAKVAARWPSVAVVLTSGDYDGAGFSGRFIRKPYSLEDTVSELCQRAKAAKGLGQ